MTQYVT